MKIAPLNNYYFLKPNFIYTQKPVFVKNDAAQGDIISFSSSILGIAPVRHNQKNTANLEFVEYFPDNKNDYAKIKKLAESWDTQYIQNIKEGLEECEDIIQNAQDIDIEIHFYGLEDKTGEIMAIAQTCEIKGLIDGEYENCLSITDIQANPKESYSSNKRQYQGLGESLVAKIVKIAKEKDKEYISVISANNDFWDSSGFFKNPNPDFKTSFDRSLAKADYDSYIEYVGRKLSN